MQFYELVEKVKEWQRLSPGHKRSWDNFCTAGGINKFDPSTKEESFLLKFLELANSGLITVEDADNLGSAGDGKADLVDRVKQWQRQGEGHKHAWWNWCKQQGTGDYDPNRHDATFLHQFLAACQSGEVQPADDSWGKGKSSKGGKWDNGWNADWNWIMSKAKGMFGKGKGNSPSTGNAARIGEIRYDFPEDAQVALQAFDGAWYEDNQIRVIPDEASKDGTKLLVEGLPQHVQWQDLKDFFSAGGAVAYAGFKEAYTDSSAYGAFSEFNQKFQGKGKSLAAPYSAGKSGGQSKVGEIRYDAPEHSAQAVSEFNGTYMPNHDQPISVEFDERQKFGEGTKLIIRNVPASVQWQELKDYFKVIGTVAYAGFKTGTDKGQSKGAYSGFGPMKGSAAKGKGFSPYY